MNPKDDTPVIYIEITMSADLKVIPENYKVDNKMKT